MLSHKLSNLLKLYRTASREENPATITHCSQQLKKVIEKTEGRKLDPISQHFLVSLHKIHNACVLNADDQIEIFIDMDADYSELHKVKSRAKALTLEINANNFH